MFYDGVGAKSDHYKRAPMGLISLGDEFCARSDRALADVPGVFKLVDDILVQGESYSELLKRRSLHDAKNTVLLSQKINTNLDRLLNSLAKLLARKAQR